MGIEFHCLARSPLLIHRQYATTHVLAKISCRSCSTDAADAGIDGVTMMQTSWVVLCSRPRLMLYFQ